MNVTDGNPSAILRAVFACLHLYVVTALQAILDDNEVAQLITLENPVDRCVHRPTRQQSMPS